MSPDLSRLAVWRHFHQAMQASLARTTKATTLRSTQLVLCLSLASLQDSRDSVHLVRHHLRHRPLRMSPPTSSVRLVFCKYPLTSVVRQHTDSSSNTIPTDVVNFSQQLQVRDPVRVLVRREGGANSQESVSSVTPGINIKHTYVYLTITGSARSDAPGQADVGPGTIGSGRGNGGLNEEASRAREYKLDTLVRMLDDYPLWQGIIHVGTYSMLEAVVVSSYTLQLFEIALWGMLTNSTNSAADNGRHSTSLQTCRRTRRKRSFRTGDTQ